jgi:acyl-CoA thioesterase I
MIARYAALALLVASLGCGREKAGAAPAEAATGNRDTAPAAPTAAVPAIMFVGTSLTAGLGVEPDQAYPAIIQQKLDSAGLAYRVVNAGVSGETSAGAVRRIDWLLRDPVAILVLETGANDGLRGQDPDSIQGNIQAIIDRVHATQPATRIVLVGMNAMPNLGRAYATRFEAIYPAIAKANGLPAVPALLEGVGGVDSLNQPDGIHPTPAGHRRLAANVWQTLLPLLTPSS